jgi:hypothetical protein
MAGIVQSGINCLSNVYKALKMGEIGFAWKNIFSRQNEDDSLQTGLTFVSETLIPAVCANATSKLKEGLVKMVCNKKHSLTRRLAKVVSLSASLTYKVCQLEKLVRKLSILPLSKEIISKVKLTGVLGKSLSSAIDIGLLMQDKDRSVKKMVQKASLLTASLLSLAMMAEMGIPLERPILIGRTISLGITAIDWALELPNLFRPKSAVLTPA